jgi:hypothetical protein
LFITLAERRIEFASGRCERRIQQSRVDQGAYEMVAHVCAANINTTASGSATVVDINDLLSVIGQWGPCPAPNPELQGYTVACTADVSAAGCTQCSGTGDCGGDGVVNIDDLLFVLSLWGPCPGSTDDAGEIPQDLADCQINCAEEADYNACMEACLKFLCENGQPQYCVE